MTAVFLAISAGAGQAQVAGQSDPAFQAAQKAWLSGDEAAGLTALAALAKEGNAAAQILLGMVDATAGLQGNWLMALSRAERLALLRPGGGMSGGSWLREVALREPVAAAWMRLWDSNATPAVVLEFARLDEPRAARVAALALAARQKTGFAAIADQPGYPSSLQALAILDWQKTDPERAARALDALTEGDPQATLFNRFPGTTALSGWLESHPEGEPVVALCAALCPAEPPEVCRFDAFAAMGGYHGLMRLGSPVEALVGSSTFNVSPMGVEVALRRIRQQQAAHQRRVPPDLGSACLAAELTK